MAPWTCIKSRPPLSAAGAVVRGPFSTKVGCIALTSGAGAYAQGRYGCAFATKSGCDLWLRHEAAVIMQQAKREGLILSLGGDAVVVSIK